MHSVASPTPACRARILLLWLLFALGSALYGSLTLDDPFAVEGARLVELEEQRGGVGVSGDGAFPVPPDLPLIFFLAVFTLLLVLAEVPPRVTRFPLLGAVTRAPPA